MQDLHDGLGSQLFTALARAERGALDVAGVAQVLRECIADMRMVFDVAAPEARGVAAVLGDFLRRWEGLLADAGLRLSSELEWPEGTQVPPTAALQLLRVAQEALTNVLKHAAARQVHVSVRLDEGALVLRVADDGRGLVGAPRRAGRGLASMASRAQRLGGTLEIASAGGGTQLVLRLPLVGDAR
jgi:signal transduction histidine kinase